MVVRAKAVVRYLAKFWLNEKVYASEVYSDKERASMRIKIINLLTKLTALRAGLFNKEESVK